MTEERTDQNGAPVAEANVGAEERLDTEGLPAEAETTLRPRSQMPTLRPRSQMPTLRPRS
jgi:hypothetical protein